MKQNDKHKKTKKDNNKNQENNCDKHWENMRKYKDDVKNMLINQELAEEIIN